MTDNKKICFISCINDDTYYAECLKYIQNLIIPEGYSIETICIKEAQSMAEGYNTLMNDTNAKYKVYLHQDTFIINKNFISDILKIFNCNEKIGMLGMCGAETIPTSAVWWESIHKHGKVYENHTSKMQILAFNEVNGNYNNVKVLDGLIMITQYDLPWRTDIFNGWHFYDISQCTEFIFAGYEIVVPRQNTPWCIHDCGLVETKNGYDEYRNIYLNEYSKKIFPLVSVLIPTHNRPHYFKQALESAINQTYRNIEIVVSDDSDDERTKELIDTYLKRYKNIKYFFKKSMPGNENIQKCIELSTGEYGNWLMDDDIFNIEKISIMMNYYLEYGHEISFVTSYRKLIDSKGNYIKPGGAIKKIFDKDTVVDGIKLGEILLKNMWNFIGEPTTVLLRIDEIKNGFGKDIDKEILGLGDVSKWLRLMKKGKIVYISNELSYFRIHEEQSQKDISTKIACFIDWINLMNYYYDLNIYINSEEEYFKAVKAWLSNVFGELENFSFEEKINLQNGDLLIENIRNVVNVLSKL